MTKITCPTCNGKCELRIRVNEPNKYRAIPFPDLTKLRESFEPLYGRRIDDVMFMQLLQAVKELLEQVGKI